MATITSYLTNQTELGANAFDPTIKVWGNANNKNDNFYFVCLSNSVLVEKVVQHLYTDIRMK